MTEAQGERLSELHDLTDALSQRSGSTRWSLSGEESGPGRQRC